MNSVIVSYAVMGLAWLLWSMDPILIRVIGDDVSRPVMAGLSLGMAGLIMIVPAIKGFTRISRRRDLWFGFFYYIIFATVIADLLYVIAIRNLNPGLVSLILRSQVMMAILSAWIFFNEKPNKSVMLGMLIVILGYCGTAYFSNSGTVPTEGGVTRNTVLGWLCAIAAAVLWTSGTIMGKKLMENIKSSHLCGMRMLTAGIITIAAHICCGGGGEYLTLSGKQWGIMALKSLLCSALAYGLYMYGLHLSPVTAAAAIEQAAPLFTLFVATFFLHETIAMYQWCTVTVVFIGAAIILVNQYKRAKI